MRPATDIHETPPELEDATARIEQAKHNYVSLEEELNRFLYDYVKGMVKGFDRESGNFVLQLRHHRESNVKGRSRVLVSQIVENLRTALDYMIFQLSVLNEPHLNERLPQFVIAETEPDFQRHARTQLRYLNYEQKSFVEQIQPYRGNKMLTLLGKMTNAGKHRRLLSIQDRTGFDIYFAEMEKRDEYKGCFVYPAEKRCAVFARPKGPGTVLLMDRYDAMPTLKGMIEHAEDILLVSFCFFQGRPLKLKIVRD